LELSLKELKKGFSPDQDFLLEIPELTIRKGELFGIIGQSGCGKTTLLRIIAGLLTPDKGKVFLQGKDVTSIPSERRGIAMVFQQDRLFPYMNIIDNVAFGLKMKGISKKERYVRSSEFLSSLGLQGYEKRYPLELSGGQRQRVSLARALVMNPSLVLMDEPFSALDPNLRKEMRDLVLDLHEKYGMTTLFVTHDREEAFYLFQRMAIIVNGRVTEKGIPRQLYEHPSKVETAAFLGIENIFQGTFYEDTFSSDKFLIPIKGFKKKGRTGYLIIRPELIELVNNPEENARDIMNGMISQISYSQGILHLRIETPGGVSFHLVDTDKQNDLHKGDPVRFRIPDRDIIFLPEERG